MRTHDPPCDLPLLLRLSDGVLLITLPQGGREGGREGGRLGREGGRE